MEAVAAHAGEEILYVLLPILLIVFFVVVGRRREPHDAHDDADSRTDQPVDAAEDDPT